MFLNVRIFSGDKSFFRVFRSLSLRIFWTVGSVILLCVKQRRLEIEKLTSFPSGANRLILATGKLIGEGFDDPQLDTLFLAMPISWRGTLQQYAGRLHRLRDGKKIVQVYDYIDENLPVLMRMFYKRLKGYRAMGYASKKWYIVIRQDDIFEMLHLGF